MVTRVWFLPLLLVVAACETVPGTSRTGAVEEVQIAEEVTPLEVRVRPGDEVWFVNRRTTPIWIAFDGHATGELSCRRGFAKAFSKIDVNGSASLCFAQSGRYGYRVQSDPAVDAGSGSGAGQANSVHAVIVVEAKPPGSEVGR